MNRKDERFVECAKLNDDEKWVAERTDGYNEPVFLDDEGDVVAWKSLPEPFGE